MGANAMVEVVKGSSISEAFRTAQDQDVMENGHSYSGGIGMAAGYRIVSKPLPQYAAEALGERLLGDEQNGPRKWGEAHVIPVTPITKPRQIEMEVDVTGLDWDQRKTAIEKAITPKLRQGEAIESVIFNGKNRNYSDLKGEGKYEEKIVKVVGKGKLVKRYLIAEQYGENGRKTILGACDTLEQAQEFATKTVARQYGTDGSIVIWPYQKREDGPLYTYKKITTKETIYVQATVGVPSGTPESWVVAGVYSS